MKDLHLDQIKKLWILKQTVDEGSMRRAATRIKITPSAISQTITSLEKSYGRPLLIRTRGEVSPTADAVEILEVIRPAFEAFEKLQAVKADGEKPTPKISWMNFGTYESIAIGVLPGLLREIRSKLPNVRLGVRISRTSNLLSMVRSGELCSALVTETDGLERFYRTSVGDDRLGVFLGRRAAATSLGWKAIDRLGLGTIAPGKDGYPRYFSKFMKATGCGKPAFLSDSFEALKVAAEAGVIPAVLPARVARRSNELVEITPPTARTLGTHGLFVVSLDSCDRAETDFISNEVRKLLSSWK